MKTTRTIWTMLVAGSLLASCQSGNKPVAYQDTTANATLYDKDGVAIAPATPDTLNTVGNTTNSAGATAGTTTDTTTMVCRPKYPQKAARVAYSGRTTYTGWHKTRRKSVKKTEITTDETNVATVEPTPTENTLPETPTTSQPETPTTPTTPITYESKSEFTGNIPATPKRAKVHLAPEVGGTLNNLYNIDDRNYTTSNELKVGVSGGLMMDVELGRRWYLEPGVRYIMKGAILTSTTSNGAVTTDHKDKLTFHYVEVPVNFVYNFGDWGTSHFMIGAGPYVSYLANAQDKTKDKVHALDGDIVYQGQHSIPVGNPNNSGTLRSVDAGGNAFIGYQINNGLYFKAGAEAGLLDMQRSDATSNFNNRNYNFLLSVGYLCGYNK